MLSWVIEHFGSVYNIKYGIKLLMTSKLCEVPLFFSHVASPFSANRFNFRSNGEEMFEGDKPSLTIIGWRKNAVEIVSSRASTISVLSYTRIKLAAIFFARLLAIRQFTPGYSDSNHTCINPVMILSCTTLDLSVQTTQFRPLSLK